eukprot:199188_1
MSLTSIWDQLRRNLLTFGYVRSTFKDTPKDIIKVILSFYDDMKYWTIHKGKQMSKFFNCECKEIMYGPQFTMENIEFQCLVAPNGYEEDHKGKIALILSVIKVPKNVKYVYVYFILFNNETKYEHKVTRILTEHKNDQNKYRWRSRFPWATNAVNLCDLKSFDSITFGYYVDIIHISYINDKSIDILNEKQKEIVTYKYMQQINININIENNIFNKIRDLIINMIGIKPYWTKGIKISNNFMYEWIVSNDKLKQMQNCQFGQHFYSSNFDNNNWCIMLFPNGNKREGTLSIGLNCLCIPHAVSSMEVKFALFMNEDLIGKTTSQFRHLDTKYGFYHIMEFDAFKKKESISFKAEVEIVNLYDKSGMIVDQKEWQTHGIMNP